MYDEGKKGNPGEKGRDREDGCEIERKKGRAIELSAKQREPRGDFMPGKGLSIYPPSFLPLTFTEYFPFHSMSVGVAIQGQGEN